MNYVDVPQRSDGWFAERLGSLGGSEIYEATVKLKSGKYSSTRDTVKMKKVLERIGIAPAQARGATLQHGIDQEPNARVAYEFARNVTVREVGMFKHNRIAMSHSSPDGVIDGSNIGIEIKAPTSITHLETLMSGQVPEKYLAQCMWHMACAGFEAVDYVSYDPRFPPEAQLFIKRIPRDNAIIAELEAEVEKFIAEVDALKAEFEAKFGKVAA